VTIRLDRRRLLTGAGVTAAAAALSACAPLSASDSVRSVLDMAEQLTMRAQRLLLTGDALAREFTEADLSPVFKSNGTHNPDDAAYQRLAEGGFPPLSPLRLQGCCDLLPFACQVPSGIDILGRVESDLFVLTVGG